MWTGRLRKNHSLARPACLAFFDCESRDITTPREPGQRHRLWFGCCIVARLSGKRDKTKLTHRHLFFFHTPAEFWGSLTHYIRPGKPTWLFAHNAAFDATMVNLWEEISSQRWKLSFPGAVKTNKAPTAPHEGLLLIDDPPTAICIENEAQTKVLLLDTLNYFRCPLAELGELVNLPKLPMPQPSDHIGQWCRYCQRDTEIVERTVTRLLTWWDCQDLGKFRVSAPGLAMSAFRHRFMQHDIDFDDNPHVRQLERDAYFGGQTECFYIGRIAQPLTYLDVSSLYPAVMRTNPFPVKLKRWNLLPEIKPGIPPCELPNSIAEVELIGTDETFPARNEAGVFYCRGPGWTVLPGPELAYAAKMGYVKSHRRWSEYITRPIFTLFVEYFWQLKAKYESTGNPTYRRFVKLMMNSLSGKWGQRGGKWHIDRTKIPLYDFGAFFERNGLNGNWVRHLCLFDTVLRRDTNAEPPNAFPAISAFVTSYARQHMRELRRTARQGNVFYQATDSLLVSASGLRALQAQLALGSAKLGALRVVAEGAEGAVWNLGRYSIGNRHVHASRKQDARCLDQNSWQQLQFDGLESIITRGAPPEVRIEEAIKHHRKEYAKGYVQPDGWVLPFPLAAVTTTPTQSDISEVGRQFV